VVQHVGNPDENLRAQALFVDAQILHDIRVEVPGGKATQAASADLDRPGGLSYSFLPRIA
jgi:hypothetical protein